MLVLHNFFFLLVVVQAFVFLNMFVGMYVWLLYSFAYIYGESNKMQ